MTFIATRTPVEIVAGAVFSFLLPFSLIFLLDYLRQKQRCVPKLPRYPFMLISWISRSRKRTLTFLVFATFGIMFSMYLCMANLRRGSSVFFNPQLRNRQCFNGQDDPYQVCDSKLPTYKKYMMVLIDGWAWDSTLPTFDLFTASDTYNLYRIMCRSFRLSTSAYTTLLTGLLPMNFDARRVTTDSLMWQLKYSAGLTTRFYGPSNPMRDLFDHNEMFAQSIDHLDEERSFEELFGRPGETRTKEQIFAELDRMAEGVDGMFLNSILLDHLQHIECTPNGPRSLQIAKMLNQDIHWFKEWIDSKNGEYLMVMFSDHGSPHDDIELHGPPDGGNENWVMFYAPNLAPEKQGNYRSGQDWIDIMDVAATISQYIEKTNIPADNIGTIKPRTNDPEERARLLHRNAEQMKTLVEATPSIPFAWNKHLYEKAKDLRSSGQFAEAEQKFVDLIADTIDPVITFYFPFKSVFFLATCCGLFFWVLHNYDFVGTVAAPSPSSPTSSLDGHSSAADVNFDCAGGDVQPKDSKNGANSSKEHRRATFFWKDMFGDIMSHAAFGLWLFCFVQFSASHRFHEREIYQRIYAKIRILLAFATLTAAHYASVDRIAVPPSDARQKGKAAKALDRIRTMGAKALRLSKPSYAQLEDSSNADSTMEMEELPSSESGTERSASSSDSSAVTIPKNVVGQILNQSLSLSSSEAPTEILTSTSSEKQDLENSLKNHEPNEQKMSEVTAWEQPDMCDEEDGDRSSVRGSSDLHPKQELSKNRNFSAYMRNLKLEISTYRAIGWAALLYFVNYLIVEDYATLGKAVEDWANEISTQRGLHWTYFLGFCALELWDRVKTDKPGTGKLVKAGHLAHTAFAIFIFNWNRDTENSKILGPLHVVYWGSISQFLVCFFGPRALSRAMVLPCVTLAYPLLDPSTTRCMFLGLVVPTLFSLSMPRLCAGVKGNIRRLLVSLMIGEALWSFGELGQTMGLDVNPNIPGMVRPEDEPYLSVFLMAYRRYCYFLLAGACFYRSWERHVCVPALDECAKKSLDLPLHDTSDQHDALLPSSSPSLSVGSRGASDVPPPLSSASQKSICACAYEEGEALHHFPAVYLSAMLLFLTAFSAYWFVYTMWAYYQHYVESFFAWSAIAACALLTTSQIVVRYSYAMLGDFLPVAWVWCRKNVRAFALRQR